METAYDKALLQRVRRLRLGNRGAAADVLGGYRSRQKGHGLEYIESRAYEPGDDVRRMDWKVMARVREPHVKVFQEERQLRILCAVDVSNSMRVGSAQRTKLQTALSCAMAIMYAAAREHDLAQLLFLGEGVETIFPPVSSEREFRRVSRDVEKLDLSPYTRRRPSGQFEALGDYVMAQRHKPQLIFVFSDFAPAELFTLSPAKLPRGCALVPVRIVSQARSGRLWLRTVDGETGVPAGRTAPAAAEKIAGRLPVEINDRQDLWQGLLQVMAWARRAR